MKLYTFVIVASAAWLAACGAETSSQTDPVSVSELPNPDQPAPDGFTNPGGGIAVVNGSQAASIDISLPGNIDSLDPKLADLLRSRANEGIEEFVSNAETDRRAAEEGGYPFHEHSLEVKWMRVGPESGRLASYLGTYSSFAGGAHPNTGFEMLNWDRDASAELKFADIFADVDAARVATEAALKDGILVAKRERLDGGNVSDEEMLADWVDPVFEDNNAVYDEFTISPSSGEGKAGGLIYHFGPYAVGSYAEGPYQIGVPQAVFSEYLKPEYAETFSGQPVLP